MGFWGCGTPRPGRKAVSGLLGGWGASRLCAVLHLFFGHTLGSVPALSPKPALLTAGRKGARDPQGPRAVRLYAELNEAIFHSSLRANFAGSGLKYEIGHGLFPR